MFPNSPNTSLCLLSIVSKLDSIGNKELVISDSKEVVGIASSITSSEYQTSVAINVHYDLKIVVNVIAFNLAKYALVNGTIYKIERTFMKGQFIELYLSESEIKYEDLIHESKS